MTTLIPAAIVLMTLTNAAQASPAASAPQQWRATTMPTSRQNDMSSLLEAINGVSRPDNPLDQALRTVFIVPGPDLNAESLGAIREDMMVMCRILDKTMGPLLPDRGTVTAFDPFIGVNTTGGRSQTQGLYLDGYGAVFFLSVGFPLVAPPQEPEQTKTEQSADPLWSRTVDELKGTPQDQEEPAVPEYDAQKVDNLKKNLIKSLRHAANMRTRGPQDLITVVVTTRGGDGFSYAYTTGQPLNALPVEPSAADSSDVLVFRTAKSDVDAFAKGGLTLEQFTEKVQVLRSWTNSAGQPAAAPMIELPSTGRGSSRRR